MSLLFVQIVNHYNMKQDLILNMLRWPKKNPIIIAFKLQCFPVLKSVRTIRRQRKELDFKHNKYNRC